MINIITLLYNGFDRIKYYKEYINSINNSYNIDNVNFFFFVEPESENMIEMIPDHWKIEIFRNYYRFKPALSHYVAFNYCFDVLNLDHAFLIEDDIISSPDIFNLINFWRNCEYFDDHVLCSFNKHRLFNTDSKIYQKNDESLLLKLYNKQYFSCWGTGFSKVFWDNTMKSLWRMDVTFDSVIDQYYSDIKILSPTISRTNQIGEYGINYTPELWKYHGFNDINISNKFNGTYRIENASYN